MKTIFVQFLSRFFRKFFVIRINTMNYRYASFGIPILKEHAFINEKGLGFGANGVPLTKDPDRPIDEGEGIPALSLARFSMMTCKNVSEVAKLWENSERAADVTKKGQHIGDFGASVWCDKDGGILMIEQSHSYIISVFGNSTETTGSLKDILWHANHNQWLDPYLTGTVYPSEYPSSAMRAERARELLETEYGNITLDFCKKLNRDSTICRHPSRDPRYLTIYSWIVVPKEMTVYWTRGNPCRSRYIKTDFSKIFGS